MSELTHQGAFRLIYKRRRTEAEQGALQSHLQHCAECRQDAEMAGMFNDHLVLKELPTRPSPQFTAVFKESAARRDTTIGDLVAESLEFYGIKTSASADELVAAARAHSGLTEDEATALAVEETRAERAG